MSTTAWFALPIVVGVVALIAVILVAVIGVRRSGRG